MRGGGLVGVGREGRRDLRAAEARIELWNTTGVQIHLSFTFISCVTEGWLLNLSLNPHLLICKMGNLLLEFTRRICTKCLAQHLAHLVLSRKAAEFDQTSTLSICHLHLRLVQYQMRSTSLLLS